jgi:hypothetical protein
MSQRRYQDGRTRSSLEDCSGSDSSAPLLGISVFTVVEPNVDFEVDREHVVAIRMDIHPPSNS